MLNCKKESKGCNNKFSKCITGMGSTRSTYKQFFEVKLQDLVKKIKIKFMKTEDLKI